MKIKKLINTFNNFFKNYYYNNNVMSKSEMNYWRYRGGMYF